MARPSLGRTDYIKAGAEKGLEYIGGRTPSSVFEVTQWRCLNCGEEVEKSIRAVKYGEVGHTCQNRVSLKPEDYNDLANRLGIKWVGSTYSNRVPRNTKTPTLWMGVNDQIVEATYQQLAYGMSHSIRRQLGLDKIEETR